MREKIVKAVKDRLKEAYDQSFPASLPDRVTDAAMETIEEAVMSQHEDIRHVLIQTAAFITLEKATIEEELRTLTMHRRDVDVRVSRAKEASELLEKIGKLVTP